MTNTYREEKPRHRTYTPRLGSRLIEIERREGRDWDPPVSPRRRQAGGPETLTSTFRPFAMDFQHLLCVLRGAKERTQRTRGTQESSPAFGRPLVSPPSVGLII